MNIQFNRGFKGCIEYPRTSQKHSLKAKLMEARMESQKVQLRQPSSPLCSATDTVPTGGALVWPRQETPPPSFRLVRLASIFWCRSLIGRVKASRATSGQRWMFIFS
ncbi:hypothetical protein HU200_013949 [Digitaria exilis]|uniref:Uncharacterized protein n=1 Tax=Digitaria exilis TaxID=1010633 RepID=A0A835FDM4_9POAL|nr:hypothetical protein HU200_013949 [Digitaria exilis]